MRPISALLGSLLLAACASTNYEVVHRFAADTPPGNVAVGPDGRMFLSLHGFWRDNEFRVVEVLPDGSTRAYPNATWSRAPQGPEGPGLVGVLGLRVDARGVLWLLDGQSEERRGRLVAWDTNEEALQRVIELNQDVTEPDTFLNDLAIDLDHETVYVADSSGAILVIDLKSGFQRRVLVGASSTVPERVDLVFDGRPLQLGGEPARIGINPITIDATNEWLYFGPMSGTSMYRARTRDLRDPTLTAGELVRRVERYGRKPLSDGSTVDSAGNVYITAVTDAAIGVTAPDGTYRELFSGPELPWPDGFAVGPDGWIYCTISELHRSPGLNGGEPAEPTAFQVIRFRPLAPAVQGR